MKSLFIATLALIALTSCGPKSQISETRMIHAPSRQANCKLDLIQPDSTSKSFNQTWEILGYVTFSDPGSQDPFAKENRELLRPRACGMGGTAVAVAVNAVSENSMGAQGSTVAYMVLRPKSGEPEKEEL